jgi:hypothetical protein
MSIIANNADRFCNEIPLGDPDFSGGVTLNQALAGRANPRTLTKPTIVAPLAELSYWRTNPTVTMSQLNTKTTKYPRLAGWNSSDVFPSPGCPPTTFSAPAGPWSPADAFAVPQQPNVYTATDVFEPINATNGIAFTPRFPDTTILVQTPTDTIYFDTDTGTKYVPVVENYTSMGNNAPPGFCDNPRPTGMVVDGEGGPNITNVFDPRLSGYGSSDRAYLDQQLGQTRYFYDDIDAVRAPQYITRNKLDSCLTPYGDAYGNLGAGHLSLADTRVAAEKSWMDNSLAYRDSLMKSLMRKKNEEQVQRRLAPKNTYGSRRTYGY